MTLELFCDALDAVQPRIPGLADFIQLPDGAGELRRVNGSTDLPVWRDRGWAPAREDV